MLDFLLTAVVFIVIFSVLIIIHELGHFYAAKLSGIKVEEFGFGLPPRIWGIKKGETLYSVNWLPFGGFVRLLGENPADVKLIKNKRSFISKPPRLRIFVITAGVLMNFLLSIFLLTFGFLVGMQPLIVNGDDVIKGIDDGVIHVDNGIVVKDINVDFSVGIDVGDKVISFDGVPVYSSEQISQFLQSDNKVDVKFFHDGVIKDVFVVGQKSGFLCLVMLF